MYIYGTLFDKTLDASYKNLTFSHQTATPKSEILLKLVITVMITVYMFLNVSLFFPDK